MKALKELRRAAGLSQRELADALGVSYTAVNKWELGRSWPAAPMLPRLANILECSLDDLYAGEGAGSAKDPGGASPSPTNDHNVEGTA